MFSSLYIAKSKIRQGLLALFFTNPGQRYYLRQMQRLLGYSAGSIRRELLRFQKDGLFETAKAGNLLYYSLNLNHPLFKELKSIVSKTVGIETSLRQALLSVRDIEMAFIYGSYAKNKEGILSDIDLFVIGKVGPRRIQNIVSGVQTKLGREINQAVYAREEITKKIREKNHFMLSVLKGAKIFLKGTEDDLRKLAQRR